MKLSKTFFTGILALTLVFALFFSACKTDDDSGSGGGGGGDSLTGSWVNNRTTPTEAVIFTDEADAAITGAKVAYYSTSLTNENNSAGAEVTIGGPAYTLTVAGNTLTLTGYSTDATGNPIDVIFDRAKGTSGSTMHGVWVSRLASTHAKYTLLIIRSGNANVFTAVGSANWGQSAYSLSSDANTTYIKWGGNGNPVAYTKATDPTGLDITSPGGVPMPGLVTLSAW